MAVMQYTQDKAKEDYPIAIIATGQSAFVTSRNRFQEVVIRDL